LVVRCLVTADMLCSMKTIQEQKSHRCTILFKRFSFVEYRGDKVTLVGLTVTSEAEAISYLQFE